MPDKSDDPPCLHCAIVATINRHAGAQGELDSTEVLLALAQVTTQIMRQMAGAEQYPEDGLAPDAERSPSKTH